jgi:exopolysaccharide biosynthesis protein
MGGFREDYKLIVGAFTEEEIAAQGYVWAFEFGPLFIVNGEKTGLSAFSGGLSPRTAIGQTADGSVLLLVIDGRQPSSIGATYQDVQTVLYDNGAVNAIGLDGGSSTSLVLGGTLINSPSGGDDDRLLPNAIIF